jgi:hypothetical protein
MYEIPLNKFEKQDLIIKLLEEGKTYRDICHLAHVSPRDIKPIAKEYERKKKLETKNGKQKNLTKKSPSISTQAFILYQEGKKLDEVKVLLDIPFKLALKYRNQYLKSIRMFEAFEFYQEYSYDIPMLLSIATFMNRNNVSGNNILNVLRTANDILRLNQTYSNLKTEIKNLEQKRMRLLYYSHSSYSLQPLPLNTSNYNYYSY